MHQQRNKGRPWLPVIAADTWMGILDASKPWSPLNRLLPHVILVRVACGSISIPALYEKAQALIQIKMCKRSARPNGEVCDEEIDMPCGSNIHGWGGMGTSRIAQTRYDFSTALKWAQQLC